MKKNKVKRLTLFLISILFIFIFPFTAQSQNFPINWEPDKIHQNIGDGVGVVGPLTVTFQSQTRLTNVDLRVVPGLEGFVRVEPNHFDVVEPFVPNSITIHFSVRPYAGEGLYDGVVMIKSGKKTLPQNLKINVNVDYAGAQIPSTTKVLDTATVQLLVEVSNDYSILKFSLYNNDLLSISPGDVIVCGPTGTLPNGLLRKVESIYTQNGFVIVETSPASLSDAIAKGRIEISKILTADDIQNSSSQIGVLKSMFTMDDQEATSLFSFEKTINEVFPFDNGEVTLSGNIGFEISYDLIVDIDRERLNLVEASFETSINENANLEVSSNAELTLSEEKTFHTIPLNGYLMWVSYVPVWVRPKLDIVGGVEGSVSAGMTAGISQTAYAKIGIQCIEDDCTPEELHEFSIEYDPPQLSANNEVTVYAGPRFEVEFYGFAGPYAKLLPQFGLKSDINSCPWWDFFWGVRVDAGFQLSVIDVELVDIPFDKLIDYRDTLLQADGCYYNQAVLLEENFESYSLNTWPSPWYPDASADTNPANNKIVQDPQNSSNNVLKLYGTVGGCWGALTYHPIVFPEDFYIDLKVYNGSELLSGCHQGRGGFGMRHGTYWYGVTNPGYTFILFHEDTTFGHGWNDVKVHYARTGDQVMLTYWIDGKYLDTITETVDLSKHLTMDYFELSVQEGSVYFDDIRIYTD